MRYKVLVEGPALTQSGYGEHTRLVLRSLKAREDVLDVYLNPLNWGMTGWLLGESKERDWLDSLMVKYSQIKEPEQHFDIQIHVGIPSEFERKANYCVCVTAGVETTRVSPKWIENSYSIDRLIVPSEFSKWVFENTRYPVKDDQGNERTAACGSPIQVVPYPVNTLEKEDNFEIELEYDRNFLIVAQWSIRKNLENTIKWFIEEFKNDEIGLIIKTNTAKNSFIDRDYTKRRLKSLLSEKEFKNRKCKIYLLHGDLTKEELNSLYTHPKIDALISATHGEGFGLPMFEAAYNGLPVLAPGWSGHLDFLYGEVKDKKSNKAKRKALFARVDYVLAPVQKDAVWKDIIQEESMWCYPNKVDFKRKLRQMYSNHRMYLSWASKLRSQILENYTEERILELMRESLLPSGVLVAPDFIFVSDMFQSQYAGGAEMSLQTLMDNTPNENVAGINSQFLNEDLIKSNKDAKWIFGNISQLSEGIIEKILEHKLDYSFVEFDYKFCKHRNPLLYEMVEGEVCDYSNTDLGKRILNFMNAAKSIFFMSKEQMDIHKKSLPSLKNERMFVLSSLFGEEFFEVINSLRSRHKSSRNNKWLVMGSDSWVKGVQESEDWCKQNNLDYEVLWNVSPGEFLEKLSSFKGICFKPSGLDTCPRLAIEAKLLGCKLEMNDNVQHANEEWFNLEYDQIVEYLKSRRGFFWEKAFD